MIIGLSGKARHGKDSTVAMAQTLLPVRARRLAFADGVRAEALATGEWDGLVPYSTLGRTALQTVGSRRRAENVNYWVDKAMFQIQSGPANDDTVWFITDVRYRNEAEAIAKAGGKLWRLQRANRDGTLFDNGMTFEQKAHPSETELDEYGRFDEIIVARTLYELYRQVGEILHDMEIA